MNLRSRCLSFVLISLFCCSLFSQQKPSFCQTNDRIVGQQASRQQVKDNNRKLNYVPGQFIVGYKKGAGSRQIKALHDSSGTRARDFNNALNAELVEVGNKQSLKTTMSRFRSHTDIVEYVEPNYIRRPSAAADVPDDEMWSQLWGLENGGESHIDILKAWNITKGSKDVIVAVVDSGVDYNHEDLKDNIWINQAEAGGLKGVDDDGNGYVDDIRGYDFGDEDTNPMDKNGHGTHVSGTIGAVGDNGVGIVGVCPNVSIMPVKVDSGGVFADWNIAEAINYASTMDADILNASWGGQDFGITLKRAIESFPGVVVVAAGNYLVDIHQVPYYPAAYDCENIICVGATTSENKEADFSSYGYSGVDIFAPGADIMSTMPGNEYSSESGTSMAAPHVAGVVALVKARYPELNTEELIQHVLVGSRPFGFKCSSRGLLNAYEALTRLPSLGTKQLTVKIDAPAWAQDDLRWRWHGSRKFYKNGETVTVPRTEIYVSHNNALTSDFVADNDFGTTVDESGTSTTVRFFNTLPLKQSNGSYRVRVTREKPTTDISKSGKVFRKYSGVMAGLVMLQTKKIPIGFPFSFYGRSYKKLTLTETGHLFFGKTDIKTGNTIFPMVSPSKDKLIAPFWTPFAYPCYSDMSPDIYYQTIGKQGNKKFIVQYEYKETVHFYADAWVSTCKVQIVLNQKDNSFCIFYNHKAPLNHTYKTRGVYGAVWNGEKNEPMWFNPGYSRALGGGLCLCFEKAGEEEDLVAVPDVEREESSLEFQGNTAMFRAVFSHPEGSEAISKASVYLYSYNDNPTSGAVLTWDRDKGTLALNDYQRNSYKSVDAGSSKTLSNRFAKINPAAIKISEKDNKLILQGPVTIQTGFTGDFRLYASCEDEKGNFTGIKHTGATAYLDRNYDWRNDPAINSIKFKNPKKGSAMFKIIVSDKGGVSDLKMINLFLCHADEEEVNWYGSYFKPGTTIYYLLDYDFLRVFDDRYCYENLALGNEVIWDDAAVLNNSSEIAIPKLSIDSNKVKIINRGKKMIMKLPLKYTNKLKPGKYNVVLVVADYNTWDTVNFKYRAVKETTITVK